MSKIGVIVTGVGVSTTINLNYCPQYLYWNQANVPQSIKVNIAGDGVVCDLDSAGINAFNAIRLFGRKTNGFLIQLANGLVKNKVTDITIVNGVAANIDLFGFSRRDNASVYVQQLRQVLLANSGASIESFGVLALPSLVTADVVNVDFRDGLNQRFDTVEVAMLLGFTQNDVNGAANIAFDNLDQSIKRVQITPNAQQTAYIMRYAPIGGLFQ